MNHFSSKRAINVAALLGMSALAACSSTSSPPSTGASAPSETSQAVLDRLNGEKKRCYDEAYGAHPEARAYFETTVLKGTKDGRFNHRYTKDYDSIVNASFQCRSAYLNNLAPLAPRTWIDLNRTQLMADAEQDHDVASGRLTFAQYRRAQKLLWDKLHADEKADAAQLAEANRQQAAAQAAEDARQAEADADEQERNNAQTTAMMGMMMGMMNQPAFTPRGRAAPYVPQMPSSGFTSSSNQPASSGTQAASKPVSTYRDATGCASLGQYDRITEILQLTNHCNAPITVHLGGEFVNLRAGQTRGYTTIARQITYACFRKSDQDDYCYKN